LPYFHRNKAFHLSTLRNIRVNKFAILKIILQKNILVVIWLVGKYLVPQFTLTLFLTNPDGFDVLGLGHVQPHMSINNLCGDLNKGYIPKNPVHPNKKASAYPL
jgi:hypothetical protein